MITIPSFTISTEAITLIAIFLPLYMLVLMYFTYLDEKYSIFFERGFFATMLGPVISPIVISFTIAYFITYLIF